MATPAVKSCHASVTATLEKLKTTTDATTELDITQSLSISTEPATSGEVKPSWNLFKELESLIHKFNLPDRISKLNRESRTLLGDLKVQVPAYLSSVWTQIKPQDLVVEETKEDDIKAPKVEAAPSGEVAPTIEAASREKTAPAEESSPAPEMTKTNLGSPW
jgi:hypothetical protein